MGVIINSSWDRYYIVLIFTTKIIAKHYYIYPLKRVLSFWNELIEQFSIPSLDAFPFLHAKGIILTRSLLYPAVRVLRLINFCEENVAEYLIVTFKSNTHLVNEVKTAVHLGEKIPQILLMGDVVRPQEW